MNRGGRREGAGAKSTWNNPPTTTIRVPHILAEKLLKIARILDNNDSIEEIIKCVSVSNKDNLELQNNNILDNEISRKIGIEALYYITHINNVPSILEKGILSHSQVEINNIETEVIYNSQIINKRRDRKVNNRSLWEYANLYFQPRNAMLYFLVSKENNADNLAIICIKNEVLERKDIFISMGNAASQESNILTIKQGKLLFAKLREQIDKKWWDKDDGSKRKIMAECLIPDRVDPKYIQSIYVANQKGKNNLTNRLEEKNIFRNNLPIVIEKEKFFQAQGRNQIGNISIVEGDMFFSQMQTLTISVNCVGIMGKGLASTAKYRFPDLYVKYQDVCKKKRLKLGQPYIYKRESSVFEDLSDQYLYLEKIDNSNQTWFLLFPTKNHWKNKSEIKDIEEGLKWLCRNYKQEKIESLAMPALGCGLGGLNWKEVGPLMCKYLSSIDIPVAIYLPTEKKIPNEFVSKRFLIS